MKIMILISNHFQLVAFFLPKKKATFKLRVLPGHSRPAGEAFSLPNAVPCGRDMQEPGKKLYLPC